MWHNQNDKTNNNSKDKNNNNSKDNTNILINILKHSELTYWEKKTCLLFLIPQDCNL